MQGFAGGVAFGHPGGRLGRHRHKAPFIGVGGVLQQGVAQPAAVLFAGLVAAGRLLAVRPADGTDFFADGAAHAHLLLDAAVDLQNEAGIGGGAHHVGPGLQGLIGLAPVVQAAGFLLHRAAVNAGGLLFPSGVVVKNAGLSAEQHRQLFQRRVGKAFVVSVQVVIAQHQREGVDLLGGQPAAAVPGNGLQLRFGYRAAFGCDIGLVHTFPSLPAHAAGFCLGSSAPSRKPKGIPAASVLVTGQPPAGMLLLLMPFPPVWPHGPACVPVPRPWRGSGGRWPLRFHPAG